MKKVKNFLKSISIIQHPTGLFFDSRSTFIPTWTIYVSLGFLIVLVVFIVMKLLGLFIQILNINTYTVKKNMEMIGKAAVPVGYDLIPWNL